MDNLAHEMEARAADDSLLDQARNCLNRPTPTWCYGIIGQSRPMRDLFEMVCKVAQTDSTLLITGETGTGKGLMAREIHQQSQRSAKPFVQINCGAIPDNLLESELFGHERGAFTGATTTKTGKFEVANGGTLFLDEIGDMSLDLQVKLLRVLEENEFERVGGHRTIKADVRVIAATHRDLEKAVEQGDFREDLYYRIYVIPLKVAPLRERQSDVPLLIAHFLAEFQSAQGFEIQGISDQALERLKHYPWPGNVRELRNVVERMVVLHPDRQIGVDDLPARVKGPSAHTGSLSIELSDEGICLNSAVSEFERSLIMQSLEKTKWVKNRAAQLLRLKRTTLVEKIKRHQIKPTPGS